MRRNRRICDNGPGKIGQRWKSQCRWLYAHQGRMAERADSLVDIIVMVRQQISCRSKGQQRDRGNRQDEDEFGGAMLHFSMFLSTTAPDRACISPGR